MNNRKTLRLESTERTQGQAELDQLLAALDITEDTFNEWRQLIRAMRQIGPRAEKLTFDELCSLAQRGAENYERFLVCNGRESDEDTELFDLTDTEQTPTVLTIPVKQVRGILPNVPRMVPAYLYSAAIVALLCGLILMVHTNQPFQHVDNNVRKETTTPTPSDAEIPKLVLAKIEKVSQTTRPKHRSRDTTTTQEPQDTTPKAPVSRAQQIVQERSTASSPTVVQPQAVLSSEPPQDSRSMEGIRSLKLELGSGIAIFNFEFFLKSKECFLKSEANLKGSGVKPTPSPSPSVTPEKSLNEKERSRGQNGV